MKTKLFFLVIIGLFLQSSCTRTHEPLKEGKIVIIHSYTAKEGNVKTDTSIMYFKNGSTRSESNIMGSKRIMIYNKPKGEDYSLFNDEGYKYATKRIIKRDTAGAAENRKKIEALNSEIAKETIKPDVKLTGDTKEIFGFNCKKAILTFKTSDGKQQSYDCWSTNEIALSNDRTLLKFGIDSFAMVRVDMIHDRVITTMVSSIEKVSVPDSLFEIPAGYPIKTPEQAEKEMIARFSIANGLPVDTTGPMREGTASDTSAPLKSGSTIGKHN